MKGFHVPSFLIDPVPVQGGIAGDQIVDAGRTIVVCEDVFDEQERKPYAFQIDCDRLHRFQFQRVHSPVPSLLLGFRTQRHVAVAVERHHELLLEGEVANMHGLGGSKPDVIEHLSERNPVFYG